MAGWDDEKLKRVVEQKKRGGDGERAKTDIVCKYFLDAIETKKRARKSRAARTAPPERLTPDAGPGWAPPTRHRAWLGRHRAASTARGRHGCSAAESAPDGSLMGLRLGRPR